MSLVENEKEIKKLKREYNKLNKKLAPYFEGMGIINKIWREYQDDSEVGKMLRRRDKVILMLHDLQNGDRL